MEIGIPTRCHGTLIPTVGGKDFVKACLSGGCCMVLFRKYIFGFLWTSRKHFQKVGWSRTNLLYTAAISKEYMHTNT